MGGFVYDLPLDSMSISPASPHRADSDTPLEQAEGDIKPSLRPLTGIELALHLDMFQYPGTTEAEIKDKSNTDSLAKLFTIFQISHLVLSIIVRSVQRLPVSQLEVLTLAFAVCGVVTYAVFWYKPKDVFVSIHVGQPRVLSSSSSDSSGSVNSEDLLASKPYHSFWRLLSNGIDQHGGRIPNDSIPHQAVGTHQASLLLALVSALFSSLHAIA